MCDRLSGQHLPWWCHQMETFSALLPFVRGIHRLLVNSPHKDQWCRALMFSLICTWANSWINNGDTGDLRRQRAHYDVIVMHICRVASDSHFRGNESHRHHVYWCIHVSPSRNEFTPKMPQGFARFCQLFWRMLPGQQITINHQYQSCLDCSQHSPADGLVPAGARPSTGTVTKFRLLHF